MATVTARRRMPDVKRVTASTITLGGIIQAPGADDLQAASANIANNPLWLLRGRTTWSTPAAARCSLLVRGIIAQLRVVA